MKGLSRLINPKTKKVVLVPMDHGSTVGPIKGLINPNATIKKIIQGGADGVILHKGIIKNCFNSYEKIKLILHLSASTSLGPDPNHKVLVADLEEAKKLKANAVSIHVNIGAKNEAKMLQDLGKISKDCSKKGIPLIAMMYPRGNKIKSEYDPEVIKHVARVGAELGADIIKTNYTGDKDSFKQVIESCPVPVIIAGGPKTKSTKEFLQSIKDAIEAGAIGVAIGRNIFQAKDITKMVKAIVKIVHGNSSVEKAMEELK